MIWEAIQRAKSEKLNLVGPGKCLRIGATPSDSASPENVQVMLVDFFSGFRMRFSTNSYITDWINLKIGISMGYTISPILLMFVMAMEVILEAAEDSVGSANLGGGCYMSPLKGFMDDITIICSNEDEARRMLERIDVFMAWCRINSNQRRLAVSQ